MSNNKSYTISDADLLKAVDAYASYQKTIDDATAGKDTARDAIIQGMHERGITHIATIDNSATLADKELIKYLNENEIAMRLSQLHRVDLLKTVADKTALNKLIRNNSVDIQALKGLYTISTSSALSVKSNSPEPAQD